MATREEALAAVRPFTEKVEGLRLTGYLDTGGKPTIGYGHTGPDVQVDKTISEDIADIDLKVDLGHAADQVDDLCSEAALSKLDAHQRGTLYDFAFNLGANPKWQIWGVVKKGPLDQVPTQIKRFIYGKVNGVEKVIDGLEHRREAEIVFWNTADVDVAVAVTQTANAVPAPPSSYTRSIETPPAPIPAPPGATASLIAKSVTIVGGAAAALGSNAQQVHDVVAPYSDVHPIFKSLTTISVGAIVVAGIVGVFIHVEQARARKT